MEQLTLQWRHRRGIDYAVQHAEVNQAGLVAYRKMAGAIGEGAHLSANGGAIGLVTELNNRLGNHNKLFDALSPGEMTSIKTYVTGHEDPSGNYAAALREMIGAQECQKLDALSDELWMMRQREPKRWAEMRDQLPLALAEAPSVSPLRLPGAF